MLTSFSDICIRLLMEKLGHNDYEVIVVPKKNKKDTYVNKVKPKAEKEIQIITLKKYNSVDKICIQVLKNGREYYDNKSLTVFINRFGGVAADLYGIVNILMTYKNVEQTDIDIIGREEIDSYAKKHNLSIKASKDGNNTFDKYYEVIKDYYNIYKKYPTFSEDEKTYKAIRNIIKAYTNGALPKEYIEAFNALTEWKWDYYRLKDNGIILYALINREDKKKITMEEIKAYKKYCKDNKDVSDWFRDQVMLSGIKSFI